MRHVPHLFLPGPWEEGQIPLSDDHVRHLVKVLRLADGAALSYTDGDGAVGNGTLRDDAVVRGSERLAARPEPEVAVAVAPPRTPNRLRFLVEKLAELGIDRIYWLATRHGEGRPPPAAKAVAWAQAALEQSRGAWLLEFEGPISVADLPESSMLWAAERESSPPPSVVNGGILVVGPEAGFAEGEVTATANRIALGARVLRVETAAVVGAAVLLDRSGRLVP
jgi:16S rRNA (uracil1498-N3)-methyltransferase